MRRRWFLLSPLSLAAQTRQVSSGAVSLKVAAVQFRSTHNIEENTPRVVSHLRQLAAQGVRVAVFPECALTGYDRDAVLAVTAQQLAAAEAQVRAACREYKIAAIVGSAHRTASRLYNVALVINAQGELVERYAKVYLAGEKWFTPGNHIAYFELEGVTSTVIICHDERYPELIRLPAIEGARVAYYISHESGVEQESKLAPYRAQLMARAVENGVHIVAANAPANRAGGGSHGQSRIVAPDGNVRQEASIFGEDVLIEALTVKPGRLERPLNEALGDWWRGGVEWMRSRRGRELE
ncbi:MAG: carbon-nitrogen hydrolase family protein [Acidobacteria bacterium]|nr:carbon-nitrogen hydrolase family protein [Acidobacteriota bacterium]